MGHIKVDARIYSGNIKHNPKFREFLTRGIGKVRIESILWYARLII